jgi:ADP-heptose:LPS heptosyltransferase
MMAVLSKTRLLIANDSAPLHIAVGFNRAIVAIFGPTDPSQVGPYQRDDTLVLPPGEFAFHRDRDDQSLIARVSVEAVWAKTQQQLQTRA